MSYHIVAAVREAPFWRIARRDRCETKAVLTALAYYADDDGGHAYPSEARLGAEVLLTRKTVHKRLTALRDAGIITEQAPPGQHRARMWQINLAALWLSSGEPVKTHLDESQMRTIDPSGSRQMRMVDPPEASSEVPRKLAQMGTDDAQMGTDDDSDGYSVPTIRKRSCDPTKKKVQAPLRPALSSVNGKVRDASASNPTNSKGQKDPNRFTVLVDLAAIVVGEATAAGKVATFAALVSPLMQQADAVGLNDPTDVAWALGVALQRQAIDGTAHG